jgi:hypothetical protein
MIGACFRGVHPVFAPYNRMFRFDFHTFIWPDDFYRKSSTPKAPLSCR